MKLKGSGISENFCIPTFTKADRKTLKNNRTLRREEKERSLRENIY
jgi:hypothetical protein